MKSAFLAATVVLSALVSAFGITGADITPAALVGKTLTFTIVNGGAPYPTNGTWTGTFAASGNAFAIDNVSGDTVPASTTYSAVIDGIFTDVSLGKFIDGRPPAKLSLFVLDGVARYEVVIDGVFGISLNGTFTIGSSTPAAPEIAVLQSNGRPLTDGAATASFGRVKPGVGKVVRKFTIRNTGKGTLTGIAITRNGKNQGDFAVSKLAKSSLAAGDSMPLTVTFKTATKGSKTAAIHIKSNDKSEPSFDIKLTGEGRNRDS